MRKITKRITALIIAAMMLASMIPAAAAETVTPDYEFKFTRASHDYTSNTNLTSFTVDDTVDGDKWGYINAPSRNTGSVRSSELWFNFKPAKGYTFDPDADPAVLPAFLALEIVIEDPGTYTPQLLWTQNDNSPYVELYLIKAPEGEKAAAWKHDNDKTSSAVAQGCLLDLGADDKLGTVKMQPTTNGGDESGKVALSTVTIADGAEGSYYLIFVPNGASAEAAASIEKLDSCRIYLKSFSLTRVAGNEEITDAFKPDSKAEDEYYNEPAVITISKDGANIESEKNTDGTHNITAPATNKAGKEFLYWAKGLSAQKRILLGKTNELKNYVPDAEYANYLIPVYEGDISGDEYYNANGQLIPGANQETRVSMPGYGASTGWAKYGDNIYVATYELAKPKPDIDITVTGGTGTGTYAFGDVVTCTANGTGTFKYWKKNDEIVSSSATYTFKAWETCTVEAVYDEHVYFGENMKIIIDTFDVDTGVTGVMAEFIGLSGAVEKGIMFTDSDSNTTKIAMTTKDNQFTVVADEPGKYVGYAILKSGDVYNLITDGEYEKK